MDSYDTLRRTFSWNIPQAYNLGEALSDRQVEAGMGTAVIAIDREWREHRFSFHFLSDHSNKMANLLRHRGCREGDRVAVMLPQSIEAAVAHVAILKCGMISLPLIPEYNPAVTERLRAAAASAILTTAELADVHAKEWADLPDLRTVVVVTGGASSKPGEELQRLLSSCRSEFARAKTNARDPATLSFTSGSEGAPKGVLHAHGLVHGILPALLFTKMPTPQDVVWSHFDWGWLGGLLVAFGAWYCGSAVLVHHQPALTPRKTIDLLRQFNVSRVSIAPTALKMLRQGTRSAEFPRLTSITSGGEKLDPELRQWVRDQFRIELSEIYGLTECSAVMGSGYLVPPVIGALGKPAPGQDVQILSSDGGKLAAGERGLIAVKRPHPAMFLRYWQDEVATAEKFTGSYLMTGDVGFQDEAGYFWYISRADDIIKSGGRRIGPSEIEDAFSACPAVKLCAAVGIPDALIGESISLWVQLAEGYVASPEIEAEIVGGAKKVLASYQIPHRIRFVDDLPCTSTGKVHRQAIKKSEIELSTSHAVDG